MVTRAEIDEFMAERKLALVGISRTGKGFGNTILKELGKKGYEVFPVHPEAQAVSGVQFHPSLDSLPEEVGGVVIVVSPDRSEEVVRAAANLGILRVWLQQGAESEAALCLGEELGITVIHGECILMYAEPAAFIHRLHRGLRKLFGRMPR